MNVVAAPSDTNVWYALVDVGGPYRSDDAGATWRPLHRQERLVDCGPYASMARGISVDPRDADSFVTATGNDPKLGGSLVISRDGGQTFRKTGTGCFRSNGPRRMHGQVIDRDPFAPNVIIAGEYLDGFHISRDNGESWADCGPTGYWFSDLRYDLVRSGTVYACAPEFEGRGGFFRSIDGGVTWTRLSEETPTEVRQIAGRGELLGLFHDRVRISEDCGGTWHDYSNGLILENLVTDGDPNPSKSTGVYIAAGAGSSFWLVGNRRGDIFIRRPGDAKWTKTARESQRPGDPPAEHSIAWSCKCRKMDALCSLVVLPDNEGHWLACDWHVIWESTDAGLNWTTRVKGITPLCPFAVSASPAREDIILYGVADMGMYVSTDGGQSFSPERATSGANSFSFSTLHPLTGYAVGGKFTADLIRTDDGGVTWRKLADMNGLPAFKPREFAPYSVAVDPLTDDVWLAVSGPCRPGGGGTYRSSDSGATWQWAGDGLPEGADLFKGFEFDKGHADSQLLFSPDGSLLACSQKTGDVMRFDRATSSWTGAGTRVEHRGWGTRLYADPHVPGRFIHAGTPAVESLDGGRTFHPYPSLPPKCWALAFDAQRPGSLVAGGPDGLWASWDGGATFEPVRGGLDVPANGSRVMALDRGRLFLLTFGAGVWVREINRPVLAAFPSYHQTFEASFATEAEAAAARCAIAPLPGDAKLAFGCRWDDTNPAHLTKAAMMERVGVKGTFYLCADSSEFFREGTRKLVAGGHAVGNHALGHPNLFSVNPNAAFRSIAANRIALETNLQHAVTSFVMPYGWGNNPIDPEHRPAIAAAIVATGHFVTQDNPVTWPGAPDAAALMPSWRFSADDSHPSRDLFEVGFRKMLDAALASPDIPRLGFGTHSWCNAEGNAIQESLLKEHCLNPDWAQLNDWEYGAYRYEALHGGIRKVSVNGNRATFEATRFFPAQVGADIPLSLKFSGAEPLAVGAGGKPLGRGERGTWALPHEAEARQVHDRISCVAADGTCPEFPGLHVSVSPDEENGIMRVRLSNRTGRDLRRISVAAAFPPKWSHRSARQGMASFPDGATFDCAFDMGVVVRKDYAFGSAYYPVSVDFTDGDGLFRVWCETAMPCVEVPETAPSRATRVWGPADATALEGVDWTAASVPGTALPDGSNWRTPDFAPDSLWCLVEKPRSTHGQSNAPVRELAANQKQGRFFVYDFEVSEAQIVCLRTTVEARRRNVALFVNGARLPYSGPAQTIQARKGRNRVIMRADMTAGEWWTDALYVAVTDPNGFEEFF